MIYPAMLTVILLSVPLLGLQEVAPEGSGWMDVSLALTLGILGPGFLLLYAQRVLDPEWLRRAWRLPAIMIIGVGVGWSTSVAVLDALWRKDLEFARTPKFGIGSVGGDWRGKGYADPRSWGGVMEVGPGPPRAGGGLL